MMFEQANSGEDGYYNAQISLQWVVTTTSSNQTIYQQFYTKDNSTSSSIQDDTNGHNYTYYQRSG